jgi:hypothetical protein
MSDLQERVKELLDSLGETADEVADFLRSRGITGTPEDPCFCPIANLIKVEIPEAADSFLWDTDDEVAGFFVCRNYVKAPDGEITPPHPVAQFIFEFDNNGAYDYLSDEVDE